MNRAPPFAVRDGSGAVDEDASVGWAGPAQFEPSNGALHGRDDGYDPYALPPPAGTAAVEAASPSPWHDLPGMVLVRRADAFLRRNVDVLTLTQSFTPPPRLRFPPWVLPAGAALQVPQMRHPVRQAPAVGGGAAVSDQRRVSANGGQAPSLVYSDIGSGVEEPTAARSRRRSERRQKDSSDRSNGRGGTVVRPVEARQSSGDVGGGVQERRRQDPTHGGVVYRRRTTRAVRVQEVSMGVTGDTVAVGGVTLRPAAVGSPAPAVLPPPLPSVRHQTVATVAVAPPGRVGEHVTRERGDGVPASDPDAAFAAVAWKYAVDPAVAAAVVADGRGGGGALLPLLAQAARVPPVARRNLCQHDYFRRVSAVAVTRTERTRETDSSPVPAVRAKGTFLGVAAAFSPKLRATVPASLPPPEKRGAPRVLPALAAGADLLSGASSSTAAQVANTPTDPGAAAVPATDGASLRNAAPAPVPVWHVRTWTPTGLLPPTTGVPSEALSASLPDVASPLLGASPARADAITSKLPRRLRKPGMVQKEVTEEPRRKEDALPSVDTRDREHESAEDRALARAENRLRRIDVSKPGAAAAFGVRRTLDMRPPLSYRDPDEEVEEKQKERRVKAKARRRDRARQRDGAESVAARKLHCESLHVKRLRGDNTGSSAVRYESIDVLSGTAAYDADLDAGFDPPTSSSADDGEADSNDDGVDEPVVEMQATTMKLQARSEAGSTVREEKRVRDAGDAKAESQDGREIKTSRSSQSLVLPSTVAPKPAIDTMPKSAIALAAGRSVEKEAIPEPAAKAIDVPPQEAQRTAPKEVVAVAAVPPLPAARNREPSFVAATTERTTARSNGPNPSGGESTAKTLERSATLPSKPPRAPAQALAAPTPAKTPVAAEAPATLPTTTTLERTERADAVLQPKRGTSNVETNIDEEEAAANVAFPVSLAPSALDTVIPENTSNGLQDGDTAEEIIEDMFLHQPSSPRKRTTQRGDDDNNEKTNDDNNDNNDTEEDEYGDDEAVIEALVADPDRPPALDPAPLPPAPFSAKPFDFAGRAGLWSAHDMYRHFTSVRAFPPRRGRVDMKAASDDAGALPVPPDWGEEVDIDRAGNIAVVVSLTYAGAHDKESPTDAVLRAGTSGVSAAPSEPAASTADARAVAHAFRQQGFFVVEVSDDPAVLAASGRHADDLDATGTSSLESDFAPMHASSMPTRSNVYSVVRSALANTLPGACCVVYIAGRGGYGKIPGESGEKKPVHYVLASDTATSDLRESNVIVLEALSALSVVHEVPVPPATTAEDNGQPQFHKVTVTPTVFAEVSRPRAAMPGEDSLYHGSYALVSNRRCAFGGELLVRYLNADSGTPQTKSRAKEAATAQGGGASWIDRTAACRVVTKAAYERSKRAKQRQLRRSRANGSFGGPKDEGGAAALAAAIENANERTAQALEGMDEAKDLRLRLSHEGSTNLLTFYLVKALAQPGAAVAPFASQMCGAAGEAMLPPAVTLNALNVYLHRRLAGIPFAAYSDRLQRAAALAADTLESQPPKLVRENKRTVNFGPSVAASVARMQLAATAASAVKGRKALRPVNVVSSNTLDGLVIADFAVQLDATLKDALQRTRRAIHERLIRVANRKARRLQRDNWSLAVTPLLSSLPREMSDLDTVLAAPLCVRLDLLVNCCGFDTDPRTRARMKRMLAQFVLECVGVPPPTTTTAPTPSEEADEVGASGEKNQRESLRRTLSLSRRGSTKALMRRGSRASLESAATSEQDNRKARTPLVTAAVTGAAGNRRQDAPPVCGQSPGLVPEVGSLSPSGRFVALVDPDLFVNHALAPDAFADDFRWLCGAVRPGRKGRAPSPFVQHGGPNAARPTDVATRFLSSDAAVIVDVTGYWESTTARDWRDGADNSSTAPLASFHVAKSSPSWHRNSNAETAFARASLQNRFWECDDTALRGHHHAIWQLQERCTLDVRVFTLRQFHRLVKRVRVGKHGKPRATNKRRASSSSVTNTESKNNTSNHGSESSDTESEDDKTDANNAMDDGSSQPFRVVRATLLDSSPARWAASIRLQATARGFLARIWHRRCVLLQCYRLHRRAAAELLAEFQALLFGVFAVASDGPDSTKDPLVALSRTDSSSLLPSFARPRAVAASALIVVSFAVPAADAIDGGASLSLPASVPLTDHPVMTLTGCDFVNKEVALAQQEKRAELARAFRNTAHPPPRVPLAFCPDSRNVVNSTFWEEDIRLQDAALMPAAFIQLAADIRAACGPREPRATRGVAARYLAAGGFVVPFLLIPQSQCLDEEADERNHLREDERASLRSLCRWLSAQYEEEEHQARLRIEVTADLQRTLMEENMSRWRLLSVTVNLSRFFRLSRAMARVDQAEIMARMRLEAGELTARAAVRQQRASARPVE